MDRAAGDLSADRGLAAVARLRRITRALSAGTAPAEHDCAWLAGSFDRYLVEAPAGLTIERALSLDVQPGTAPWHVLERQAQRDELLRRLAAALPGNTRQRVLALQRLLRGYAGVGWRRDCGLRRPAEPGEQRALLFALFTLDPEPPSSERRLTDILNSGVCS